jgi:photosystem II stability/assembly factor-like uncharacterized protein
MSYMNNINRLVYITFCFCFVFVFSACSLSGTTSTTSTTATKQTGSFLKSFDGGKNWENKVKIDDKTNIGLTNVLSVTVSPKDGNVVYIGTEKDGLLVTKDGAETWQKLVFPLTKIYGLAIDKNDDQIVYASGVLDKRAKIFKSINGGKDWVEIYTEPANDSAISRLEISQKNPNVLYCGTSEGVILKTSDGGQSWKNIFKTGGPIIAIAFDAVNDNAVYFAVSGGSVFATLDGGGKTEDLGKMDFSKIAKGNISGFNAYSIETDPQNSGVLYVGTSNGMFKGSNFGKNWEEVSILESSKKFPIRAIAVNPKNSNEIMYSNSQVIYRSVDGGANWFTFQLTTDKVVNVLKYNPLDANIIFAGLRKI